jgi:hypothetical protein
LKLKGNNIPRNTNPANPLKEEVHEEKQLTYYVDLDGTLAYYKCWGDIGDIGDPIQDMKKWVLYWLKEGIKIKIFTARAYCEKNIKHIRKWLLINGFPPNLEITNIKGLDCDLIFDNNAREVINNTGIIVDRTGKFNIKKINE